MKYIDGCCKVQSGRTIHITYKSLCGKSNMILVICSNIVTNRSRIQVSGKLDVEPIASEYDKQEET